MRSRVEKYAAILTLAGLAGWGTPASFTVQAATITWGTPTSITDENDISLAGTLLHAGHWSNGDGTINVTVGSETIPFEERPS